MFREPYDTLKWRMLGWREPKVGEYVLHYDQDFNRIIVQVKDESETIKKCFIMKRIGY